MNDNKQVFLQSAEWFANCMALIAMILVAPEIVDRIEEPLDQLLIAQHGYGDWAAFLAWMVKMGIYGALFFALRMSLVTAFVTAATAFAVRYAI